MLSSLLRFELGYHFRQVTFRIAALLFFVMGLLSVQTHFGSDDIYKNAPYVIAVIVSLLSLNAIFVAIIFSANVVIRDSTYKMDALLFTTSLRRGSYFLVRFAGLFISLFILLLLALAGLLVSSMLFAPSQTGPFHLYHYIQPLIAFGVPNLLFISTLLFCTSLLTQNAKAIYVTGVLLYVLYLLGSVLGDSPLMARAVMKTNEPDLLPILLDPFGLTTFFGQTRFWTTLQRNQEVFAVSGGFLINRIAWTCLSVLLLAVTYRCFSFRTVRAAAKKAAVSDAEKAPPRLYRSVGTQAQGWLYSRLVYTSQLKMEVRSLFKHIPFVVMIMLWTVLFGMELNDTLSSGFYGIHFYTFTGIIANELLAVKLAMLLIIFYAAELVGREKSANIHGLVYSTPVPHSLLWAAKFTTLGVLIAVLVTVNILIGVTLQLFKGHMNFEWPIYFSLYYYSGMPLLLYAVLALFIQVLIPNKYLGILINVAVAGVIVFSKKLGIEHYLLRYAVVPKLDFSYINGFGHYAGAFNWYMLYWGGLALLLSLVSILCWHNGTGSSRRKQIAMAWSRRGKAGQLLFAAGLLIWLCAGVYIYYQTNVIGKYKSSSSEQAWQLAYERQYKPKAQLPQPDITATQLVIDLYPAARRYTVTGQYQLKNTTKVPIHEVWIGIDPEVTHADVEVADARLRSYDEVYDQYWFQLKTPLQPGQATSLTFNIEVKRSGFMSFDNENSIVANGSYIELAKYLPFIGYNGRLQSDDKQARKQAGLVDTAVTPSSTVYQLTDVAAVVSTEADQHVCMPGILQRSWTKGDRRYFSYKTERPINFAFALSSARYTHQRETYKGIALNIYYQAGHAYNVASMMQGMKDALDYCSSNFALYPLQQLTIAEIPQYRGTATAYPGMIFSAERNNFLADYRDSNRIDYAYATVLHETAHQWWAHLVSPVLGPGYKVLTESLAKYTEAMALERVIGPLALRQYMQADNSLYFLLRNSEPEPPLTKTTDQNYIYYQKGAMALYAIRESIGEAQVNRALSNLVRQHAYPGTMATPEDLLQELYSGATPAQKKLIDEQLQQVIVYNLTIEPLSCKPNGKGQYQLQLEVNISKIRQETGKADQLLPVDDELDVALFETGRANWNRHTKPIYLKRQHFTQPTTILTITVDKRPAVAAIDPFGYIPDGNQTDNIAAIDAEP